MKTVYSDKHTLHYPAHTRSETGTSAYFDKPDRALTILKFLKSRAIGPVIAPEETDGAAHDLIRRVHAPAYVDFLENAHREWTAAGHTDLFFPAVSALQNPAARAPRAIEGRMGLYMADSYAPITDRTWDAALASTRTALTAANIVASGERAAFALCRPPGHHAGTASAGGYCYINNAAVAAQAFIERGAARVAILDVDYHHGNGTQDIFYSRGDVLCVSLHADPADEYPYYLGYADENGTGAGKGFNLNYPLPLGSGYDVWAAALDDALAAIGRYDPAVLIVSLGVDTYEGDPISQFRLSSGDFTAMGRRLGSLNKPTLFVMEGGYAVDEIGLNVTNVLAGFDSDGA